MTPGKRQTVSRSAVAGAETEGQKREKQVAEGIWRAVKLLGMIAQW